MYKTLSAPLTVQIEIGNACTDSCIHCYNFWRQEKQSKEAINRLSLEDVKIIINKLVEMKVFEVVFTGGEPLLNKSALFYGIKLARDLGMGVSLNSNLVPLIEKDAYFLRQYGVHSVLTSVLGPNAEVHDAITLRKGSFEKTIQGIKYLQKVGLIPTVNIVVSQKNKDCLKDTMRYLSSIGIKHISSTRAGWPGNCPDFSSLSLSLNDFRSYLNDFYNASQELHVQAAVLESYPYCGIKELSRYRKFLGRRCSAGVTTFTVGADGLVRPCSHLDVNYGNLLTENLETIWLRMGDWRNGKMIPSGCKICSLLKECGGGCRMEAKMHNGSFSAIDPYSSLSDIDYAWHQLHQTNNSPKKKPEIPLLLSLPNGIRIRKESFGSVVFVKNHFRGYLNNAATDFLSGLESKKTYSLKEVITTTKYDKAVLTTFISELSVRGMLTSSKKGGEGNGHVGTRI